MASSVRLGLMELLDVGCSALPNSSIMSCIFAGRFSFDPLWLSLTLLDVGRRPTDEVNIVSTLLDVGRRPTDEVNIVSTLSPRVWRALVLGYAAAGRSSLWGAWAAD